MAAADGVKEPPQILLKAACVLVFTAHTQPHSSHSPCPGEMEAHALGVGRADEVLLGVTPAEAVASPVVR